MFAQAQALLQRHKIRPTFTRIATMAILLDTEQPMSVDTMFNVLRKAGQQLSRASVYRALTDFQKVGLVLQGWEDIESGKMAYVRAHGFGALTGLRMCCRACGRRVELRDRPLAQQLYLHALQTGFDKGLHDIEVHIACNACVGT